ncbi:MAG: Mth938-like domain-containing protein [Neisseria sp.]|uniref:Mth938-like domain-containing protein n=1 Tax=Neisseria sp. TaxID=192066 RepID=UPI0026DBCD98|nr:Mth938-like domain-containing protein [Neisseria sp.]MDO4248793.1 Mth938-like domain-containing protein [Neisseria sp.]
MQIEENLPHNTFSITACNANGIEINGSYHTAPICLTEEGVFPVTEPSAQALDAESFSSRFGAAPLPEVILVGTGATHHFLHPKIAAGLAAQGIGLETMTTAAACRTFMVLQSEGRRVWAWLWP